MSFIKALEKKGYSRKKLKELFERDDIRSNTKYEKLAALTETHRIFVQNGVSENIRDARVYSAIDQALDISQHQITYTLVRGLIDKDPNSPEVLSALESWNLKYMLCDVLDDKGKPNGKKTLDIPAFTNIYVPLVAAYTHASWARQFSEVNVYPLFRYDPSSITTAGHMVGKVITHEITKDAEHMGYRAIERGVIFPALAYGVGFVFAESDYYIEKKGWVGDGGEYEEYVSKQGIKWVIPHCSKVFYDRAYPLTSLNTDTGCRWAGYWQVVPYSSLGKDFWNLEKICYSGNEKSSWMRPENWKIYTEFYPCSLKFPDLNQIRRENNREDAWTYHNQAGETACQVCNVFHKINPKQYGLYDYDQEVWHLFVYAGDGTVINCVPFAYLPCNVDFYNHDMNRRRNTSFSEAIIPFQDHIGNLLTQHLHSIKSNLGNIVFYDSTLIAPDTIKELKNLGEKIYRQARNFVPFNRKKQADAGSSVERVIFSPEMAKHSVTETGNAIATMLTIMERILGVSPQEVGASASHEQSAEETRVNSDNSSNRVGLTSSFLEDGRAARQRAAYDAWFEYSPKQIDVELDGLTDPQISALKTIGFKVEGVEGTKSFKITGKRELADLYSFVQNRPANERAPDEKIAQAMLQSIGVIINNPAFIQYYGVPYLMNRFGDILEYTGVPSNWRLESSHAKQQPPNPEMIQQALDQNNKQLVEGITKTIAEPLGKASQQLAQKQQQTEQGMQQLVAGLQQLGAGQQQLEQGLKQVAVGQQQLGQESSQQDQAIKALFVKIEEMTQMAVKLLSGVPPGAQPMPPPQMVPQPMAVPPGMQPQVVPAEMQPQMM